MTFDPSPADRPEGRENNPALRARVPDNVAGGTFSTGAIVMTGPSEFVLDFLQTIGRPHRVAARVVLPHPVMPQFIDALQKNLEIYRGRFGDLPTPPGPPNPDARRPSPQEIYDDLKLPDEVLSGTYANGVMIGHGATEFGLDFLTSFFPQSAVSARIFLSAGQVPRLLESLKGAVVQLQQRKQSQGQDPPGGSTGPGSPPAGPSPFDPPSNGPSSGPSHGPSHGPSDSEPPPAGPSGDDTDGDPPSAPPPTPNL